jgi:F-type H+-transporting ATPase subunit epsilon
MESELNLEIVTPFGKLLSESIASCTLPGTSGQFQVLKDHAALITTIDVGTVKVEYQDTKSAFVAVSSGFCEVKDNQVEVIVESAEFADSIDVKRAESAKDRAEKRLSSGGADIDVDRAKLSLMRAINRIKVSELK